MLPLVTLCMFAADPVCHDLSLKQIEAQRQQLARNHQYMMNLRAEVIRDLEENIKFMKTKPPHPVYDEIIAEMEKRLEQWRKKYREGR